MDDKEGKNGRAGVVGEKYTPYSGDSGYDQDEDATGNGKIDGDGGDVEETSLDIEDGHERETWTGKLDFLLACVGFSVGLGNVWRFPYLCYKNGGGAFLLPYFICVIIGGIPLFFLEVAVGQFMSIGGTKAWNIVPLFQGIAIATTVTVFILNCYYNVIMAWAFYYLFSSFTSVLPWSHCDNYWNTDFCTTNFTKLADQNITVGNDVINLANRSLCYDIVENNGSVTFWDGTNATTNHSAWAFCEAVIFDDKKVDSVIEFWERKVLSISPGIDQPGVLKWDLSLCLLLAWVVVYFCICKGIKSSGKVMYVTATSPYILMIVLLIRGVTLDGAKEGVLYYLTPDFGRLLDMQVWVDAGTQIFFSYSIALGALTALGSYNKFHHDCYRDSIIFALTNSGTSFLAGFVIFSVLGYMAQEQGVDIAEVAESGPGLTFIAYPKALAAMPISPLWSILFFIMVILLGLDSEFVGVEGVITTVVDQWPGYLRKGYRREIFIGIVCFVTFLVGLPMCTEGGMYVFQLFDYYGGSKIVLLVSFIECAAVSYVYGIRRFYDNLEMMLGYRIGPYMFISWLITSPIYCLVIFVLGVINYSELSYKRPSVVYEYPAWAVGIGWCLALISIIWIPIVMIYKLIKYSNVIRILKLLCHPSTLKSHQLRPLDMDEESVDYLVDSKTITVNVPRRRTFDGGNTDLDVTPSSSDKLDQPPSYDKFVHTNAAYDAHID
ncbi:sodium- and chloride-dependent taurine transporter-like [Liolophura sinensis]|uniref:sodium- and chloride-dependent taurine transporter-like n=1 Tax=Liolophura sinensis TaxID=3198878 RepID=UPI00315905C9